MFRVFVAHPIPLAGLRMLADLHVTVNRRRGLLPKAALMRRAKSAEALITLVNDRIDDDVLAACPNLRLIANYAVGFDNIDVSAAAARGIVVTNTPDVLTEAVAEHAIALMLAAGRRVVEADAYMRAGKYEAWQADLFLGKEFMGATIGILGCGRIGARVAEIAHHGFGMKILYHDMARNAAIEKDLGATFVDFIALLRQADVVSVHVPLLPSTYHLIDNKAMHHMQPHALLINTARGPVVDEAALVEALHSRVIAGAAIDVFEHEPAVSPGLSELDNIVLTPHIASATTTARDAMASLTAQAVLDVAAGKTPRNIVTAA